MARPPFGAHIVKEIKNPRAFDHYVVAFATANALKRFGNEVGLVTPARDRRADFWLSAPSQDPLSAEVKTPGPLGWRTGRLDQTEASRIVSTCLDSAGTGSGGQLSRGSPARLIVGGVGLGSGDCATLELGARGVATRVGMTVPHLFGVLCVGLGFATKNVVASSETGFTRAASPAGGYIQATVVLGLAPNMAYQYAGRDGIRWPKLA